MMKLNSDMMKNVMEMVESKPVEIPFKLIVAGMDSYFAMIEHLIRINDMVEEEARLKRKHRAYLHVHEQLVEYCDDAMSFIYDELLKCADIVGMPDIEDEEIEFPFNFLADNAADKVDRALYEQAVSDVMKLSEFVEDFTDGEICKLIMMKARPEDFPNVDPDYVNAKLAYYWEAADLAEDVHCRYEEEPCEYFSD